MKKRNPWAWIPTLYFAEGLPNIIVTEDKIQPTNIIKHWTRPSDSVAQCVVSSAESCESGNP